MARKKPTTTLLSIKIACTLRLSYIDNRNTRNHYQLTYDRLITTVGPDCPVTNITADTIVSFLDALRNTPLPNGKLRRPKTLDDYWVAISSLWSWLVEHRHTTDNIMDRVPRPKIHPIPIIPHTDEEIRKLLEACQFGSYYKTDPLRRHRRPTAVRDTAIISLLLETGLRASELCNLNVSHITITARGGSCYVDLGKGGKSRVVYFGRRCARALISYQITRGDDIAPDDPFFVTTMRNDGMRIQRKAVAHIVAAVGRLAGLDTHPHRLRTTALCKLAGSGMNAFQIQIHAGHSDMRTTQRYVKAAQLNLEQAIITHSVLDNTRL